MRDVSLSVRRGEIFGLLGANGAGKSTLVECLVGTRQPEQGTSAILGQDVRRNRRQLFERVGVQFQDNGYSAVSYTHLDVYKRQLYGQLRADL